MLISCQAQRVACKYRNEVGLIANAIMTGPSAFATKERRYVGAPSQGFRAEALWRDP